MPRLGFGELLVIGFVLLVVFSASRMGTLGNAIGKFVHSFKKASKGEGFIDVKPQHRFEARHESAVKRGDDPET
jgi:sec-independent protein translocase protein TatA